MEETKEAPAEGASEEQPSSEECTTLLAEVAAMLSMGDPRQYGAEAQAECERVEEEAHATGRVARGPELPRAGLDYVSRLLDLTRAEFERGDYESADGESQVPREIFSLSHEEVHERMRELNSLMEFMQILAGSLASAHGLLLAKAAEASGNGAPALDLLRSTLGLLDEALPDRTERFAVVADAMASLQRAARAPGKKEAEDAEGVAP